MSLFGPNIKKMKEKMDIGGLIKELKNKDPRVRIQATKAIGDLKHIEGLIEASKNDNPEVRIESILALQNARDQKVMQVLIDVLTKDRVEAVWRKAFDALGGFNTADEATWAQIGGELLKDGRYQNALTCFAKAMEIKPDRDTILSLSVGLLDHSRYEDALQYFEKLLEIDPNDARGWGGKSIALSNLNRGEEAVNCCKKALEIEPTLKGARDTLGAIYYGKGEYKALASLAQETLELEPKDTKARLMLSEALALTGKLIEAESEAEKALEFLHQSEYLKPEDTSVVHQQLGIVYAMRGFKDKSLEEFQKAVDAQPTDEWSHELLESYKILNIIGVAMKGTPIDRRNRLFSLTQKRSEARKGEGVSRDELAMAYVYKDESPIPYMSQWAEGVWLDSSMQGVMLKLWPSDYLAKAAEILARTTLDVLWKHLQEKIES